MKNRAKDGGIIYCRLAIVPKPRLNGKPTGNKVVGFIIFDVNKHNMSEMLYLLIDKDYRNKGYGSALMNQYMKWFNNSTAITSYINLTDDKPIPFYERYGFTNNDEIRSLYREHITTSLFLQKYSNAHKIFMTQQLLDELKTMNTPRCDMNTLRCDSKIIAQIRDEILTIRDALIATEKQQPPKKTKVVIITD